MLRFSETTSLNEYKQNMELGSKGVASRIIFLVAGEEWEIRLVCEVNPEDKKRPYEEQDHREVNKLVLGQAPALLARLAGRRRYDHVELGIRNVRYGYYVEEYECLASGEIHDKQVDLTTGSGNHDNIEDYRPYFRLELRWPELSS